MLELKGTTLEKSLNKYSLKYIEMGTTKEKEKSFITDWS